MKTEAVPEATRKMLSALWEKNLPVVHARVEELSGAAQSARKGTLSSEARQSAESTAHKLAGSLGMFGYKHGTEIAREMEQMLEGPESLDANRLSTLATELGAELGL